MYMTFCCIILYRFFREPWTCAVYHDRFSDLREEVREILSLQQLTPSEVNQHQPAAEVYIGLNKFCFILPIFLFFYAHNLNLFCFHFNLFFSRGYPFFFS